MAWLLDHADLPVGAGLRGVWSSHLSVLDTEEAPALGTGYLMYLPSDSDPYVEATHLETFIEFCAGGVHGQLPNGDYWMFVFLIEPYELAMEEFGVFNEGDLSHRLFNRVPLLERIGRRVSGIAFDSDQLREDLCEYLPRQLHSEIANWTFPELIMGIQTQLCNVELRTVVSCRVSQCAYPDTEHDCQHDVFADVFAHWGRTLPEGQSQ
jgi:hypothetical protein